jgi:hypothetical protein
VSVTGWAVRHASGSSASMMMMMNVSTDALHFIGAAGYIHAGAFHVDRRKMDSR